MEGEGIVMDVELTFIGGATLTALFTGAVGNPPPAVACAAGPPGGHRRDRSDDMMVLYFPLVEI